MGSSSGAQLRQRRLCQFLLLLVASARMGALAESGRRYRLYAERLIEVPSRYARGVSARKSLEDLTNQRKPPISAMDTLSDGDFFADGDTNQTDAVFVKGENRADSGNGTIVREMKSVTNRSIAAHANAVHKTNSTSSGIEPSDKDKPERSDVVHVVVATPRPARFSRLKVPENATAEEEKQNITQEADHLLEMAEPVYSKVTKNVGMKSKAGNVTQEAKKPFIKITKETADNGDTIQTSVRVEMVKPRDIVTIYLLMFVPLVAVWFASYVVGFQPGHLVLLLPVSLLITTVGMDFANQSLAPVVGCPYVLTALQAWTLAIVTGTWTFLFERPTLQKVETKSLWYWLAAALAFTTTQLINHVAYWRCSLYERTIFLNMCPIFTVLIEQRAMPMGLKPCPGFWNKTALSVTVAGALLLGVQAPHLSSASTIATSILLVASMVLCRLTQRFLLADSGCQQIPVSLLACIDGVMLGCTSTLVALSHHEDTFENTLDPWLQEPTVRILLLVSMLTFTAYHLVVLVILRFTSATNALVFANIGNILNVALGVQFFGDSLMRGFLTPVALMGLAFSLFSGVWYAAQADRSGRGGVSERSHCNIIIGMNNSRDDSTRRLASTCICGNVFMADAVYCRKCGKLRGEASVPGSNIDSCGLADFNESCRNVVGEDMAEKGAATGDGADVVQHV